jgi:hypothetical protein
VVQTLTHCLSVRLDLSDTPDWSNGEALKAWLLDVKAQAEGFLHAAGITTALEVMKSWVHRAEPPDPNHLAPYNHSILSETFPEWFMGLKDGIEVM